MSLSRYAFGVFALLSGVTALVSLRFLVAPLEDVVGDMAHYLTEAPWSTSAV